MPWYIVITSSRISRRLARWMVKPPLLSIWIVGVVLGLCWGCLEFGCPLLLDTFYSEFGFLYEARTVLKRN